MIRDHHFHAVEPLATDAIDRRAGLLSHGAGMRRKMSRSLAAKRLKRNGKMRIIVGNGSLFVRPPSNLGYTTGSSQIAGIEPHMTPSQCRAGRALIRISQAELAARAGVCRRTIVFFEATGRNMQQGHVNAVKAALAKAGVEMIDGEKPGVRAPAEHGARH